MLYPGVDFYIRRWRALIEEYINILDMRNLPMSCVRDQRKPMFNNQTKLYSTQVGTKQAMINYLVPNVGSRLECFYPLSVLSNLYQPLQITFDSWNHVLLLCANMSKPVFGVRRSCEAWSFVISGNIPGCSCVLGRWTVCIENFHIGIIFICIKKLEKSR